MLSVFGGIRVPAITILVPDSVVDVVYHKLGLVSFGNGSACVYRVFLSSVR